MTHENIYYLLPLIYTCEYVYIYPRISDIHSGFGYPFGFRVSAGLVLVMDFHPNRFRVRVRVSILGARRLHPIRTRPVAILIAHWLITPLVRASPEDGRHVACCVRSSSILLDAQRLRCVPLKPSRADTSRAKLIQRAEPSPN